MKKLIIILSLLTQTTFAQDGLSIEVEELVKTLRVVSQKIDYGRAGLDFDENSIQIVPYSKGALLYDGAIFIPRNPVGRDPEQKYYADSDHPLGGLAAAIRTSSGNYICPNKATDYSKHYVSTESIIPNVPYCLKNRAGSHISLIKFIDIAEAGLTIEVKVDADQSPILERTNPALNELTPDERPQSPGAQ